MKKTVALVACALALTACGSSGGRPSVEELASPMKDSLSTLGGDTFKGDAAGKAADCLAEALHDSDLSDEALRAIAEGDQATDLSAEDQKAFTSVFGASSMECMKDAMPSLDDMEMPEMPELTTP